MQSDLYSALFILYAASFCGLMFLVTYLILARFFHLSVLLRKIKDIVIDIVEDVNT